MLLVRLEILFYQTTSWSCQSSLFSVFIWDWKEKPNLFDVALGQDLQVDLTTKHCRLHLIPSPSTSACLLDWRRSFNRENCRPRTTDLTRAGKTKFPMVTSSQMIVITESSIFEATQWCDHSWLSRIIDLVCNWIHGFLTSLNKEIYNLQFPRARAFPAYLY